MDGPYLLIYWKFRLVEYSFTSKFFHLQPVVHILTKNLYLSRRAVSHDLRVSSQIMGVRNWNCHFMAVLRRNLALSAMGFFWSMIPAWGEESSGPATHDFEMAVIRHWVLQFCSNFFKKLCNKKVQKVKTFECMFAIEKISNHTRKMCTTVFSPTEEFLSFIGPLPYFQNQLWSVG